VGRDGIFGTALPYAYEERLGLSRVSVVGCLCLLSLSAPLCCGMGRGGILGTTLPYAYEERRDLSLLFVVFVCVFCFCLRRCVVVWGVTAFWARRFHMRMRKNLVFLW